LGDLLRIAGSTVLHLPRFVLDLDRIREPASSPPAGV
jgi:hypothetical protein